MNDSGSLLAEIGATEADEVEQVVEKKGKGSRGKAKIALWLHLADTETCMISGPACFGRELVKVLAPKPAETCSLRHHLRRKEAASVRAVSECKSPCIVVHYRLL
jgi:hypothetical protein